MYIHTNPYDIYMCDTTYIIYIRYVIHICIYINTQTNTHRWTVQVSVTNLLELRMKELSESIDS